MLVRLHSQATTTPKIRAAIQACEDPAWRLTERLFGLRKRTATGKHEFGTLCTESGIDHRLTPPQSPQINGMVERFNGRIEDVLQSHYFRSGKDLNATMHRYVLLYNQQLPQSVIQSRTSLQAMKDWHKLKPEQFKKNPYYFTGCGTYFNDARKDEGNSTEFAIQCVKNIA
jgi:hypothetical protein